MSEYGEIDSNSLTSGSKTIAELSHSLDVVSRRETFDAALKLLLPHVGTDADQVVLAQVLLTLKLEGIIPEDLGDLDVDMVRAVKNALLTDPVRVNEAIKLARKQSR